MDYKIISNPVDTGKEMRLIVDEIKDKIFDDLFIRVVLNEHEINDLIFAIIKEDTQIDVKELDLSIDIDYDTMCVDIEGDYDLTDSEKKYLKETLSKKYGANVLNDMINPVIKQKLNTEHYELLRDGYSVEMCMHIDIPMNDFGKRNEICRLLDTLE